MLGLILKVFALVLFCIASGFPQVATYHPRLIAAGLAFWVASELFGSGGFALHG